MKKKKSYKSSMIKRDPVATRDHILSVAFDVVYRHGFKGTSTNLIIEKLECTRGAFFHHFPTKNDLGYALIDEVLYDLIYSRWVRPLLDKEDKIEAISSNFHHKIMTHKDSDVRCGCPLNNMAQEMSDRPEFHDRIKSVLEMWISETQKVLTQAKRTKQLLKDVNTRSLAEFIVSQEESAFSMSKALGSRSVMISIYKSFSEYLNTLRETQVYG